MKAQPPCQASSHNSFSSTARTAYLILPCSLTWPPDHPGSLMVLRRKPPNPTRLRLAFLAHLCDPHLIPLAPGPSNRAYLSLPYAQQLRRGPARLRPFVPVPHLHRANQAVAHACNTRPRVSSHNVVNHSSLRSDHSGPRTLLVLSGQVKEQGKID